MSQRERKKESEREIKSIFFLLKEYQIKIPQAEQEQSGNETSTRGCFKCYTHPFNLNCLCTHFMVLL